MYECFTWGDLKNALEKLSPEQLQKMIQVAPHEPGLKAVACQVGICFGTVDELEIPYIRSAEDNTRRGDDLVLCTDANPFAEDGAVAYDSLIPDKAKAIYPKNHTPAADWTDSHFGKSPAQKLLDGDAGLMTKVKSLQTPVRRLTIEHRVRTNKEDA